MTQAKMAEVIGTTPSQTGLFLKDKASLNKDALDKCFHIIGLSIESSEKRFILAKAIAGQLKSKSLKKIAEMTKEEMIKETGKKELVAFSDVSFETCICSGLVDPESTFQYFKTLVLYFWTMKDTEKVTPSSSKRGVETLIKELTDINLTTVIDPTTSLIMNLAENKPYIIPFISNAWGILSAITIIINSGKLRGVSFFCLVIPLYM